MSDCMTSKHAPDPERVQAAFGEAVSMPALARVAFLARIRAESAPLADEVESLLGYHMREGEDLGLPALPTAMTGSTVGGCRIERLVGFGGMSAVYAATQDFPDRRVAVKVIRREATTASARRRLRVEAEALARLAHPNIARVHSAGLERLREHDAGESPYIVMELVEGAVAVTEWADRRALDARARIELVATIADAVEHAHRAGVIHRDLKPGNVIVGADGTPKVIDFGIASVRDSRVTAATEGPMGTLAYMSPEQARGGTIDTRTDVWSLGALLYELLAGRPPFEGDGDSVAGHIERLLRGRPAAVAGGGARMPGLAAETDAVLAKALASDPGERYQSAAEFGAELARLLAGEPLLARPEGEWRTLVRLARRRWRSVAAAGAAMAAVLAALAATTVLLRRESAANARAQWSAYAASISAASAMLDQGDASAAHSILAMAPEEHRGWEWSALARAARQSRWSIANGPGAQVYEVDWSPDGARIVAAASTSVVAIDAATRRVLWRVETPADDPAWRVRAMADGHVVASLLERDLLRIAPDGRVVARVTHGSTGGGIRDIATDAARTRLFATAASGALELDPTTLARVRAISAAPPLEAAPRSIAAAPDAAFLVIGDADGVAACIEAGSGERLWTWRAARRGRDIHDAAVSPDGRSVALVTADAVALLDAATGIPRWIHSDGARGYRACTFTPDGREVVASTWAESVDRLDAERGALRGAIFGAFSQVWSSAVSPDGREIASGTFESTVELFDARASSGPEEVALDGSAVECVSPTGGLHAVTADGALFEIPAGGGGARRVPIAFRANWACGLDGATILVAHDQGVAWVAREDGRTMRELATGARARRVGTIDGGRTVLARLDDEVLLACSAEDARELWRTGGFKPNSHLAVETAVPGRLFLPRGLGGAQMGLDLGAMREFPSVAGAEFASMGERSPDGGLVVLACVARAGELTLADARTLAVLHEFPNHRGPARVARWSPDGARIASASVDGTVRIWHVARRTEILTAWRGQVNDLAWSSDGTLWLACADGMLRAIRATDPVDSGGGR